MTLSRRKTLSLIGGGTLLAAGASLGGFAATRTPHAALAPWDLAGSYDEPRKRALSYALLAPNPHNRQPWEAELRGEDMVAIYRDPTRDLPITDPFARQLTIGMGCFLELMRMAAAQEGYGIEQALYPEGPDGPVAVCRFIKAAAQPDPLFQHVMTRRSHKEAFDPMPLDPADTAKLGDYAVVHTQSAQTEDLRALALEAMMSEAMTPAAWQESIDLLRIGKAEINALPDGIDVGGFQMEALNKLGVFTREKSADPNHPGSQAAIQDIAHAIAGAPGFVVSTTPGNTRADQIAAGAQWLRLNLAATGAGLAVRPVSQALQEYEEVRAPYTAIHERFAKPGETVQMLGLLGYAARTPRTPRWPLEAKLREA